VTAPRVPVLSYATDAGASRVRADLDRLVATRFLLQANSGGGKSRAIRQLLEETHGRVQHLVFDPEGEFSSLREAFPYVLAGKDGDVPATPKTAKLLCRKLMELGASAVLDLYELSQDDRRLFVRLFLTELMALPRTLWRPVLVVIDEAHIFCPERGAGEAQSTDAVISLCTQGRKRGFCAVLATQRISKLHKDAAAELLNKLVGRTGLDVDVKRAGDDLGFDKEQRQQLKALGPGEFFVYGPAVSVSVQKIVTGPVKTSHPQPGSIAAIMPTPAPAQLKSVLAQLENLPKEAEAEARTVAELETTVRQLRQDLKRAQSAAPMPSAEQIESAVARRLTERQKAERQSRHLIAQRLRRAIASLTSAEADLRSTADSIAGALATVEGAVEVLEAPDEYHEGSYNASPSRVAASDQAEGQRAPTTALHARGAAVPTRHRSSPGDSSLPAGERTCLIAIAQHEEGVSREQLSILSGYKRSTRDKYLQLLMGRGLVEIAGGTLTATDAGIAALGPDYDPLPTGDALRDYWLGRLPAGERAILEAVSNVWPDAMDRGAISGETQYKRSTRDKYIQLLEARRLVQSTRSGVRASDTLFDGARR
jgi:hypothetical protein